MQDHILNPKVSIDGTAIRRIREEKKLTQLYVAKVVGVTTDTVSRWENNRYPSIRRDNALLLAEALEVDLAAILLNGTGEAGDDGSKSSKPFSAKLLALALVVVAVAGSAYLFFMRQLPPTYTFTANRVLPSFAVADGTVPIRVRLEATGEMKGMILREHFPRGWTLLQASPPPSSLDNVEGMVRWILKPDERPPVISYLVQVPADIADRKSFEFTGEVIINPRGSGMTYPVDGDHVVNVGPFHWADTNGYNKISDQEILTVFDYYSGIDDFTVDIEFIEKMWLGSKYIWDEKTQKISISP
jgi:transcriptional regulator with XRE-family HTH domain